MRKELKRILIKSFRSEFEQRFGRKLVPLASYRSPFGKQYYEYDRVEDLRVFIVLFPNPKNDTFTLELAWSVHDQIPERGPGPANYHAPFGEKLLRIASFYSHDDPWWNPFSNTWESGKIETGKAKIPDLVNDAVNKFEEYALPYLQELGKLRKSGYDFSQRD